MGARHWLGSGATLLFVGLVAVSCGGTPTASPTQTAGGPISTTPTAPTAEAPAGPATKVGDGTYEVGTDIVAGQWKTKGPLASDVFPSCYFERAKNDTGEFGSIITNDNATGPASVTVKPKEFFKTQGGCEWELQGKKK